MNRKEVVKEFGSLVLIVGVMIQTLVQIFTYESSGLAFFFFMGLGVLFTIVFTIYLKIIVKGL